MKDIKDRKNKTKSVLHYFVTKAFVCGGACRPD
jgi:hypothetical protein